MPIKPENAHRYPPDWNVIRERIRRRAGDCCERCGVKNHALGGRLRDGRFLPAFPLGDMMLRLEWPQPGTESWCGEGEYREKLRIIRIVCTVAHLDHAPENCSEDNLRFWCQRCHLAYDAGMHRANAYQTRREGKAVDMFAADGHGGSP